LIQEIVVINAEIQARVEAIQTTFPEAKRRVVKINREWYYW
jgi:hypothetical protein